MSTVMIDGGSACPSQIHLTQGPPSSKSQPPSRRGSLEIGQLLSAELGGTLLTISGAGFVPELHTLCDWGNLTTRVQLSEGDSTSSPLHLD